MGTVVQFPKPYYSKEDRKEEIIKELVSIVAHHLKNEHNIDTSSEKFTINMSWVMKFLEAMISDELDIPNEILEEIKCQ